MKTFTQLLISFLKEQNIPAEEIWYLQGSHTFTALHKAEDHLLVTTGKYNTVFGSSRRDLGKTQEVIDSLEAQGYVCLAMAI